MTAFFIHCYTSRDEQSWLLLDDAARGLRRRLIRQTALLLVLWSCALTAWAGSITVERAELRAGDRSYRPVADFSITPSPAVERALTHGISLYFVSQFDLVHPRWYWLDETVAHDEQTVKLFYNELTRQYRIAYGGLYQNFNNLDEALRVVSHQLFAPIKTSRIAQGERYIASVRLHLDLTQLPKPLQINALVNTDWELDSGWYRWNLEPAAVPASSKEITEPGS